MLGNLMANPGVHSLENLERQQRLESVSPAEPTMGPGPHIAAPPMPLSARSADDLENDLKGKMTLDEHKADTSDQPSSYAAAVGKTVFKPKVSPVIAAEIEEPKLISPMVFAQQAALPTQKPVRFDQTSLRNLIFIQ